MKSVGFQTLGQPFTQPAYLLCRFPAARLKPKNHLEWGLGVSDLVARDPGALCWESLEELQGSLASFSLWLMGLGIHFGQSLVYLSQVAQ